MEPSKFENHIRKQIEEREIPPSSDAWLKLAHRLDEMPSKQPKKNAYFWYVIAACLVGLILLSVVLFNVTNTTRESNIQVVEDEMRAIEAIEDHQMIEAKSNNVEVVSAGSVSEEITGNQVDNVSVKVAEKEEVTTQLEDVSNEEQVPLYGSPEEIINSKVLQVLAQVDALEQDNEMLTDAEVDSLLRMAQAELLKAKLFQSDYSVDARALLSEAENELDKSFREEIFESLKVGFLKVRTAVADRNN